VKNEKTSRSTEDRLQKRPTPGWQRTLRAIKTGTTKKGLSSRYNGKKFGTLTSIQRTALHREKKKAFLKQERRRGKQITRQPVELPVS